MMVDETGTRGIEVASGSEKPGEPFISNNDTLNVLLDVAATLSALTNAINDIKEGRPEVATIALDAAAYSADRVFERLTDVLNRIGLVDGQR